MAGVVFSAVLILTCLRGVLVVDAVFPSNMVARVNQAVTSIRPNEATRRNSIVSSIAAAAAGASRVRCVVQEDGVATVRRNFFPVDSRAPSRALYKAAYSSPVTFHHNRLLSHTNMSCTCYSPSEGARRCLTHGSRPCRNSRQEYEQDVNVRRLCA